MKVLKKLFDKKPGGFWNIENTWGMDATYTLVFGERSNGKTYGCLHKGIENFVKSGGQSEMMYVRRFDTETKGSAAEQIFAGIVANGGVSDASGGLWSGVYYRAGKYYLTRVEKRVVKKKVDGQLVSEEVEELVKCETPFCYITAVNEMMMTKSQSFPNVDFIVFDEFITRAQYIKDEFVVFMNLVSTIVRQRDNVRVYMIANTVSKYNPYFSEMGLTHAKDLEPGQISEYSYANKGLKVVCEHTEPNIKGKPSDKYFAFDNPKLSMITGGSWEFDIYPHLPCKYLSDNIVMSYFILFDDNVFKCDIVQTCDNLFTYVYVKSDNYVFDNNDIIFGHIVDLSPLHFTSFRSVGGSKVGARIVNIFNNYPVFYCNNAVGDAVNNFLMM